MRVRANYLRDNALRVTVDRLAQFVRSQLTPSAFKRETMKVATQNRFGKQRWRRTYRGRGHRQR